MKRLLCLLLIFAFLFASCNKNSQTNDLTKTDMKSNEFGLPMVVYAILTELKEIKNAFDDMSSNEFYEYMKNEKAEQFISGMRNYERTKELLDELIVTTVPLLDGDENNFAEIGFYWENNIIHQLIFFDKNQRASVLIDTVKSSQTKELQLNDNAVYVSVKSIKSESYIANLYEVENADYSFFADVIVDGTYIVFRTLDFQTIEEFEAAFSRLEFIKIGDLLDRSNTETTKVESVLNTGLSDEEATTEINIATELSVESVTNDLPKVETTE